MFTNKIVHRLENEFGNFTVEELDYEGRKARVLFSGIHRAAQSGIALDDNPRMLFDYNQRFIELAFLLVPRKILVIGGGTLTLSTALLKFMPRVEITAIEINKDLIELAKNYFGYTPDPRLKIIIDDAESAIQTEVHDLYDLIFIDVYNDFVIPDKFRTKKFALLLSKILALNGVVATNCIAGVTGQAALPAKQLIASYAQTIGPVKIIQADLNDNHWIAQNLIIMASKGKRIDEKWLKGYIEVTFVGDTI